jgi:C-terminal processing protease CtpA/Prc
MTRTRASLLVSLAVSLGLSGCGGGGSGGGGNGSGWVAGVFSPANTFQALCAAPRRGTDPISGRPYPDRKGSTLTENNWLRSWSNDLYLWYNEITDQDPSKYSTTAYFDLLKTMATTPSGKAKDRFHFTMATSDWEQLAQSGVAPGYGATWSIVAASPPRQIVVAYTDPGTPATNLSPPLLRGATVLKVDGVDAVNATGQTAVDALNAGLFPAQVNEAHTFTVRDPGAATNRDVTMTSVDVTSTPVQNVKVIPIGAERVGYMLFNDHLATAEQELIDAVNQLNAAPGIDDLVLDIRYNGGGYLDIASELAYMIAGSAQASGKTFETTTFNNKHPTTDPVTGDPLTPLSFHSTSQGFSTPAGQALPTLDLPRVFVLTGSNTCSASESIINSLEGINVEVIQIGSTTCGKPYGFYPQDNCGTTYFSVEFQGKNAQGFGDYPDGFSPANTLNNVGAVNTGCSVGDDYGHALGDPLEGRLAAALQYRQSTTCPFPPSGRVPPGAATQSSGEPLDGVVRKPEWLQNRILRR